MAVGLTKRRHVHVSHSNILSVERQRQIRSRIRIRNVFGGDAPRLDVCRRGDRTGGLRRRHDNRRHQEKACEGVDKASPYIKQSGGPAARGYHSSESSRNWPVLSPRVSVATPSLFSS